MRGIVARRFLEAICFALPDSDSPTPTTAAAVPVPDDCITAAAAAAVIVSAYKEWKRKMATFEFNLQQSTRGHSLKLF